ncbi:MAG: lipoate--protein ligase [Bacteroidales bacterium]|nr:lipoate--protein ligase [Bacteroidales bacterium]
MKCILNSNTDPYFNLAAEEYVLTHYPDDVFMLWRNDKSVIIGKYQNSAAEINMDFVRENHVKVVRRMTGGGAVFHDLGNVNFTFIDSSGEGDFRSFTLPILQVLKQLGVPAQFEGRNDLTINGQKFSGNAQCIHHGRILHHGTLLFSSEMSDLTAALNVNPLKFSDKAVKSVRKRVTNISEHLPTPMTVSQFIDAVMQFVTERHPDAERYDFTEEDLRQIRKLRDEKYATWEWNFGTSPHFDFSQTIRTPGGNLEVGLSVRQGRIEALRICGDFFSRADLSELEQALIGQVYHEEKLRQVLSKIEIGRYICNATADDLLKALF